MSKVRDGKILILSFTRTAHCSYVSVRIIAVSSMNCLKDLRLEF